MAEQIIVTEVIDRIQKNLGVPWNLQGRDKLMAGDPATPVTGIATAFSPGMDVLRRAVASHRNLVIARESPYWVHEGYMGGGEIAQDVLSNDPAYQAKRQFIESNKLVIWKIVDNWDARRTDGQLRALARALAWDRYHQSRTAEPFAPGDCYFNIPQTTVERLAKDAGSRLKVQGVRILGNPQTQVRKVALSHGLLLVPELEKILKEPGVDAVLAGEVVEWEAGPYFDDLIASGQRKGLILIGHAASEEPGAGEMAAWLKTFIPETPVEWLPEGEPFRIPRS